MAWLPIPFAVLAAVFWLSTMVHWVMSLGHLSGRVSLAAMLFKGYEAFNPENFTPRGQVFQRRYGRSFLGFFACVLLTAIMAFVAAKTAAP